MDLGEWIGFVERGFVYLKEVRKKGAEVLYNMNLRSLTFINPINGESLEVLK